MANWEQKILFIYNSDRMKIMHSNNKQKEGKTSSFRRLAIRGVLFALPFWTMIVLYFYDDPFMVLRNYKSYDSNVMLNEGYVGWCIYKNNRDSIPFNSFLLGNSCTMAFPCNEWEKYLHGGRAVRLFGNAESMMAVYRKLLALEKEHADIKNVLLILDRGSLSKTKLLTGFGNTLPAEVIGVSPISTQLELLQAFVAPKFLFPYLQYRLFGKLGSSGRMFTSFRHLRNPINNDAINPREKMIEEEGEDYWKNRPKEFPVRSEHEKIAPPVIFAAQKDLLNQIAEVLKRNGTSLKLVVGPDYCQEVLNPKDVEILQQIFGKECIFDFTGINEYTIDVHNYYEEGHYRPILGRKLLHRIYADSK